MSGKNPLGLGKEPQAYEGINVIVPVGGWNFVKAKIDPTGNLNAKKNPVGTIWLNTVLQNVWIQTQPNVWTLIASGAGGDIVAINGTANQITSTTSAGIATLSLPSAVTLPGSLTVTTLSTLTGGINTEPTVVAAGATPLTSNNRTGQVTFSGVSIASGATQAFVIDNNTITGSGTVILYSWFGATAGSALSIESVVNAAGTSTITMTNGTSATMVTSTANITFVYAVLN